MQNKKKKIKKRENGDKEGSIELNILMRFLHVETQYF